MAIGAIAAKAHPAGTRRIGQSLQDWLDEAVPPVGAKYRRFVQRGEDMGALSHHARQEVERHSDRLRPLMQRQKSLLDGEYIVTPGYMGGSVLQEKISPLRKDAVEVRETDAKIEQVKADIARAQQRYTELCAKRAQIGSTIDHRINRWLDSVSRRGLALALAERSSAVDKKFKSPEAALDHSRSEIAKLEAEQHRLRSAPITLQKATRLTEAKLAALADRAPNCFGLIEHGDDIKFPMEHTRSQGFNLLGKTPVGADVMVAGETIDVLAMLYWLDPEKFKARLMAEVTAAADDANALSDEDRATQLRIATDQLLAAERAEEAAIEEIEQTGRDVARRQDVDPRALLGLSSALPPLSKD